MYDLLVLFCTVVVQCMEVMCFGTGPEVSTVCSKTVNSDAGQDTMGTSSLFGRTNITAALTTMDKIPSSQVSLNCFLN